MDAATRRIVRQRAMLRCEYCGVPQSSSPFFAFHVEHVHARQHVQDDSLENLALACPQCNLHKGPNLSSIDPETGSVVELFHPRHQAWDEHFAMVAAEIVGRTPTGRATVHLLQMNAEVQVKIRSRLQQRGEI